MADGSGVMTHTGESESTRAILEDVLRDVTNILHGEVRLARAEIKEELRSAGRSAGILAAAALCGLLAAGSLTVCAIAALALVVPVWLAALLIAVLLTCMGGGFYAAGRARIRETPPLLTETRQKVRSDYEWAKQQMK